MRLQYLLAHPSDRLDDERAGHVVRPRGLLGSLRAQGVQVDVVEAGATATSQAAARSYWSVRDRLPRPVALAARDGVRVLQNQSFARRAVQAGRRWTPDVVLETQVAFSTAGAVVARVLQRPLVLDDVSPVEEDEQVYDVALRRLARARRRTMLRAASLVIVTSTTLRDALAAEGVPDDRLMVLPNGVVTTQRDSTTGPSRASLGLPTNALVAGYAGSFQVFHGLDLLVRALADPAVPDAVHLLLVGDGEERTRIEQLAARLGVAERLHVTGRVASPHVLPLLRQADIGVLPATAAYTNPMKLYDYLAAGLPVLAPEQRAVQEVLAGTPAALFTPGSVPALAAALARLARDPARRAALAAASAAAGTVHGWDARATELRAALRSFTYSP